MAYQLLIGLGLLFTVQGQVVTPSIDRTTPTSVKSTVSSLSGKRLSLLWSDEFGSRAGPPDPYKWTVMYGDGCDYNNCNWGNKEKQAYTTDAVRVLGDGTVAFEARNEPSTVQLPNRYNPDKIVPALNYEYKSGKMYSRADNGFSMRYGKVEVRARVPAFFGQWPAVWAMPATYPKEGVYGTWPRSGELDIMEQINLNQTVVQTIHYPVDSAGKHSQQSSAWATNPQIWHTYAMERSSSGLMRWYVDGRATMAPRPWSINAANPIQPFDKAFSIIMNLAVGGNWAETYGPINKAAFAGGRRHQFVVDYVRVWQEAGTSPTRHLDDAAAAHEAAAAVAAAAHEEAAAAAADADAAAVVAPHADRQLKRACKDSVSYYVSPETGNSAPWPLPSGTGSVFAIAASFYDQGTCGAKRTRGRKYKGNAPKLRGDAPDSLDLSVDATARNKLKTQAYVSGFAQTEQATFTVDTGGSDRTLKVEVVASADAAAAATGGAFALLLDSDDCSSSQDAAAVAAKGGLLLLAATPLGGAAGDTRFYGSNLQIAAGVHSFTVCSVGSAPINLHTLRFTGTSDTAVAPGAAATITGIDVTPECLSGACYQPPTL